MSNYQVTVNFDDGTNDYDFPTVFHIEDPEPTNKDTEIDTINVDGSKTIPGGKRSHEIRIRGKVFGDNYEDLLNNMDSLRNNITSNIATLTLKYWNGSTWVNTWQYTVRRIEEIKFRESIRRREQEYEVSFFVLRY